MIAEQLYLFPTLKLEINLSEEAILKHKSRMERQIRDKTGAISRIAKARYDDLMSKKLAEENLQLKQEIENLKNRTSRSI